MKQSLLLKHIGALSLTLTLLAVPMVAFGQTSDSGPWGTGLSNAEDSGVPGGTIYGIIQQTMNWLLAILGFLAIIGFVISGILYLTAAGNEDQIKKAKSAMFYSIMGIIVALVGFVVVQAVDAWLDSSAGGGTTKF